MKKTLVIFTVIILFSPIRPLISQTISSPENSSSYSLTRDTYSDTTPHETASADNLSFFQWINSSAYAQPIDEEEEKKFARKRWKETLGVDIFIPYFKAKEIEESVKDKASVTLFNRIKGRPHWNSDEVKYLFKIKF